MGPVRADAEAFARDGVVCLRSVLDREQVAAAAEAIDAVLARPGPLSQVATPQVRFYHDHVLVKEGGTRQRTPWRQDQPYYNVDGRGVSAWIPVDPVPANGCLELLAGSHRGPWLMPRTFLTKEARWFPVVWPDTTAARQLGADHAR
jgi:ectoine hydroxylase-related dioxygenase (phytanoyl-CoA dioxygenase family)